MDGMLGEGGGERTLGNLQSNFFIKIYLDKRSTFQKSVVPRKFINSEPTYQKTKQNIGERSSFLWP